MRRPPRRVETATPRPSRRGICEGLREPDGSGVDSVCGRRQERSPASCLAGIDSSVSRQSLHGSREEQDDRAERDHQKHDGDGGPETDQARLADAVVRDEDGQQLEAVLALVDDVSDVEGAQSLDRGDDYDDDVDWGHHWKDHAEERLDLAGTIDSGRLAQRRVDAFQAGEVQDHDVADMAPARGDQGRVQIDARVSEPVDEPGTFQTERVVDETVVRGVLELPNE